MAIEGPDNCGQQEAEARRRCNLLPVRGKDQNKSAVLYQRSETRNAKWHQKEAKGLPAVKSYLRRARACRAKIERKADDQREANRRKPQPWIGIEISHQNDQIPDQVAPQNEPRG